MKNILKTITLFCFAILLGSCSKESIFKGTPDIDLVKVYTLSNITGSGLEKINVYQSKTLLIEYQTTTRLNKYNTTNYTDSSDDTTYNIVVTKTDGDESSIYTITGDKTTGTGSLNIDNNGTITNYTNISIVEEQVYN